MLIFQTDNFHVPAVFDETLKLSVISANINGEKRGLVLTSDDAAMLINAEKNALSENHLFRFGDSALIKLTECFSQSTFLSPEDYALSLARLEELFFLVRAETDNRISDDDIIYSMFFFFERRCQGSFDILESRDLPKISKMLYENYCGRTYDNIDEPEEQEYDDDDVNETELY